MFLYCPPNRRGSRSIQKKSGKAGTYILREYIYLYIFVFSSRSRSVKSKALHSPCVVRRYVVGSQDGSYVPFVHLASHTMMSVAQFPPIFSKYLLRICVLLENVCLPGFLPCLPNRCPLALTCHHIVHTVIGCHDESCVSGCS